jgi:hypothetical protein
VRRLYSSTNTSYLCCSLSQSVTRAPPIASASTLEEEESQQHLPMKNCLMASSESSSCFKRISFAFGANRTAKFRTTSANVAEKSTICGFLAILVMRLRMKSERSARESYPRVTD